MAQEFPAEGPAASTGQAEGSLPGPPAPGTAPTTTRNWGDYFGNRAPTTRTYKVPLQQSQDRDDLQITVRDGRVSLIVRQGTLREVLARLAATEGLNIVCSSNVGGDISITLHDIPLAEALTSIVSISGCTWTDRDGIIYVTSISSDSSFSPIVQGREIKIIPLDFVSGEDLLPTVKTMLSPVGNVYVLAASPDDVRRTCESMVVEDLPEYLARIEQYAMSVDQPPRQVLIQVHVLQVELEDDCRHGVNFSHLMNVSGHTFSIQAKGLAAAAAPQAFFAELSAGNLTGLLEALKTTVDAKTLASPKVLALNGQKARIQIGERLGYRVLKDTQTATLEDVKFLDVGVVLEVTPTISRDNRVLMKINPKVSTGRVDSETGLPEEATTEVETSVLLRDGQGIILGGLIQEIDNEELSKVYFLGDLYLVGALFQRHKVTKSRQEIIFFIQPTIIAGDTCNTPAQLAEMEQVQTSLLHGSLHSNHRPWEPRLPNCYDKTFKTEMPGLHRRLFNNRCNRAPTYQEMGAPFEIERLPALPYSDPLPAIDASSDASSDAGPTLEVAADSTEHRVATAHERESADSSGQLRPRFVRLPPLDSPEPAASDR